MKFVKYLIFYLFLFTTLFLHSQNTDYLFYGGAIYGGPLPKQTMEKSSGVPLLSSFAGFGFRKYLKNDYYIQFDLCYSIKGASYSSEYSHDTLIDIGIGIVPSFYTAKIGGKMQLHYIDLPITFGKKISKNQNISIGFYTAFLFKGFDKGNVFIQAGYGDFADFEQQYNNFSLINKQDFGFNIKYSLNFYENLFVAVNASRSTRGLYSNNPSNNLFHTNASISFGYAIK